MIPLNSDKRRIINAINRLFSGESSITMEIDLDQSNEIFSAIIKPTSVIIYMPISDGSSAPTKTQTLTGSAITFGGSGKHRIAILGA